MVPLFGRDMAPRRIHEAVTAMYRGEERFWLRRTDDVRERYYECRREVDMVYTSAPINKI